VKSGMRDISARYFLNGRKKKHKIPRLVQLKRMNPGRIPKEA
jgi:hypothetical protein